MEGFAVARTSAVSKVTKDVPVTVCGRLCPVKNFESVGNLQKELQSVLGVHEQDFELRDSTGKRICTDQQLEDAIAGQQVPLQAGLSDASVHLIENRREELAQMQWKVMRDKMQSFSTDLMQLTKQLAETHQQFEMKGSDQDAKLEALRAEISNQLLQDGSTLEATILSLSERVQSFTTMVQLEANKREHALQSLDNQLQDVRRVIDQERHERIQEANRHAEGLKECRKMCETQKRSLESSEHLRCSEMQSLKVEFSRGTRDWTQSATEKMDAFKQSLEETRAELRSQGDLSKDAMARSHEAFELAHKIHDIEVKGHQLDVRLSQAASNFSERQQSITERQEQIWELFEGVRADKRSIEIKTDGLSQQVQELKSSVAKTEEGVAKLVAKEAQALRDELVSLQTSLTAEQAKGLSNLETKCSERFERESRQREKLLVDKMSLSASTNESMASTKMDGKRSPVVPIYSPRGGTPGIPMKCVTVRTPNGSWSVPPGSYPSHPLGAAGSPSIPGTVSSQHSPSGTGSPQVLGGNGLYRPPQSVLLFTGSPRDTRSQL
eukprot:symbB.v1.2.018283.t1/scaffold1453.1/size117824/13